MAAGVTESPKSDGWPECRALENAVLKGPIVTSADAAAKLEATVLNFEHAQRVDRAEFDAVQQVVRWLEGAPKCQASPEGSGCAPAEDLLFLQRKTTTPTTAELHPAAPLGTADATRDPNRRLSDSKGPAAIRTGIASGVLSPGFQCLAEVFLVADDAYQIPARVHNAAEEAYFAALSEDLEKWVEEASVGEAEANDALWAAKMDLLRHPTLQAGDLDVKQTMIAEALRMDEAPPIADVLEATLVALRAAAGAVVFAAPVPAFATPGAEATERDAAGFQSVLETLRKGGAV